MVKQVRHVIKKRNGRKSSLKADKGITRCPSCKAGRIVKSKGLIFCGFCGREFA